MILNYDYIQCNGHEAANWLMRFSFVYKFEEYITLSKQELIIIQ